MSNLSYKNKKGFNPYPLIAIAFIGFMLLYQFKLKDKWYGKSDDNENIDSPTYIIDEAKTDKIVTVEDWKKFMDDEIISKMRTCLKTNHAYNCIIEFEEKLSNEDLALNMLTTLNNDEIQEVMSYAQEGMQKVADETFSNQKKLVN